MTDLHQVALSALAAIAAGFLCWTLCELWRGIKELADMQEKRRARLAAEVERLRRLRK